MNTPRTESVVAMAVGPMREYAIIEHARNLERELIDMERRITNQTNEMSENNATPKTCEPPSSRSSYAPGSPKIYRVEISYGIYVYADHERDAVDYAHDGVRDEDPEMECATLVKSLDDVPKQWRDALPYGASELIKDDKSIRQILSENV